MPLPSTPSAGPVFVIGVIRSGTSLLYSLLNQHPQIALMYEFDVWDFPAAFTPLRFQGDWLERQEFFNQSLSRHRLVFGDSRRGLESIRTPEDLYRSHSENKGAVVWGEKSPFYSARLRQLHRRYPQASFILIWRDPVEIYRSILAAGKTSPFFRQPGMLHRLIYHKEKMIRESARLERAGARLLHVQYDALVDQPEKICRELCGFLRLEFDPRMLDLAHADLAAVYREPQHDFLRRGVIERQKFSAPLVDDHSTARLGRFRRRWERLAARPLGLKPCVEKISEPAPLEILHHKTLGACLHANDSCKRLAFEFLPLPWLRTYRQLKSWLADSRRFPAPRRSFTREFADNWITILACFFLLAAIATVDHLTGPKVSLGFFYLFPTSMMTLVVGLRWGTLTAIVTAVVLSANQLSDSWTHLNPILLAWNTAMRIASFTFINVLLNRIRIGFQSNPANGT